MTKQEIFDKVSKHLLTQMQQSKGSGMCLYRNPEGLSCAVGCLISDEDYDPKMEQTGVARQVVRWFRDTPSIKAIAKHTDLLMALQSVHDCSHPDSWASGLSMVARDHGLVFNP